MCDGPVLAASIGGLGSAKARDESVDVGGVNLHVVTAGPAAGPLLVMLHGFPEFWWAFRRQIPFFVRAGYHVVAPDQRGYNASDKPSGLQAYGLERLSSDVAHLIRAAGRQRAYVLGHDWGAVVGFALAIFRPELVEKLVVINGPHPLAIVRALRARPSQLLRSAYIAAFQLPRLPEWLLGRQENMLARGVLRRTSRPGTFTAEDLDVYGRAWAQPGAFRAQLNWYRSAARHPVRLPRQGKVDVPTLLLWGECDQFLGLEVAQSSQRFADSAELLTYDDGTHWLHHEHPERINPQILRFLQG